MLKLILVLTGLLCLTGCFQTGLVTESSQLNDFIEENEIRVDDEITLYFERERYAIDERDEVFYIVENTSGQPVEISSQYVIEKYDNGIWMDIDNRHLPSDTMTELEPDDQTEQLVWLSFDEEEIEKGIYRVKTTVHYPDKTEAARKVSASQPAVYKEISLLFEIR